jgi:hypothetical protein
MGSSRWVGGESFKSKKYEIGWGARRKSKKKLKLGEKK